MDGDTMYELLLRTETLFLGLQTPVLWAVGDRCDSSWA